MCLCFVPSANTPCTSTHGLMVYIFTLQLYCTKLENGEYVLQLACTVWYCSGRDVSGCVMVFTTLHIYNYTHLYTSSDNSGDSGSDLQCSGPESKDVEIFTTHVSPCFLMYECIGYISKTMSFLYVC